MGRKILWLVVSGLMALSLVMASCAPAATPTTPTTLTSPTTPATPTTPTAPTAPVQEPPQKEVVAPAVEKPKYGGTITSVLTADITNFDSGTASTFGAFGGEVYQQYLVVDWTRGPAGSGVTDFAPRSATSLEDSFGAQLAESWEMPAQGVWVLNIRRGVRWQKPNTDAGRLMNGREMTADDIVSSWNRLANSPGDAMRRSQPATQSATSVNKTGPWQVTIKTPINFMTQFFWIIQGSSYNRVYPPEVVARYGSVADWRNAVGTGPYMLVEYVPGSIVRLIRNPDYWEKNPVGTGKGDQLPYADAYNQVIIPDLSTRLAALRTGKLDLMQALVKEDWQSLSKTSPKLESHAYMDLTAQAFAMRTDKKDKPFDDIRVRQALTLATNFEAWKRDYFGGDADIDVWPVSKQVSQMYQPLSEMPKVVQDLYVYNPDRAKQLLKEAGYPNGFKASVVTSSVQQRVDELSIYKDMWSKVGVELLLDIKETAVYNGIVTARSYEDMLYGGLVTTFNNQLSFGGFRGPATLSYIDDPAGKDAFIEAAWPKVNDSIFINMPKAYEEYKKLKPHLLEQAYYIVRPQPFFYNMWWPWLKNHYGQPAGINMGFVRYWWIDQALKKSMGY
ncbi:MAG: ABC transporter substrate-binding protein [Chloroflexota bacterium]